MCCAVFFSLWVFALDAVKLFLDTDFILHRTPSGNSTAFDHILKLFIPDITESYVMNAAHCVVQVLSNYMEPFLLWTPWQDDIISTHRSDVIFYHQETDNPWCHHTGGCLWCCLSLLFIQKLTIPDHQLLSTLSGTEECMTTEAWTREQGWANCILLLDYCTVVIISLSLLIPSFFISFWGAQGLHADTCPSISS